MSQFPGKLNLSKAGAGENHSNTGVTIALSMQVESYKTGSGQGRPGS